MSKSIFQDCFDKDDKLSKKAKSIIKFALLPWVTPEKICPLIRISEKLYHGHFGFLSQYYHYIIFKKFNCYINPKAKIGRKLFLPHPMGIVIGEGVEIGDSVSIYQQVTIGQNRGKYPKIGDNVIIYAGAKIVGAIVVGNGAVIGTNAVVISSIPDNAIVAGNPAKIIRIINGNNEKKNFY